ncbi:TniQ family protein [Cereibacter azotoformans]|uniref:TniQ family protein n=1 Tax=Cereibacter azotoformans TaxID=43057 RepID=UPI001EEA810C|nr:TniQ family protein [Cereibacter azotoformans]ULB11859.1 TniQ family protein [Cereibacter azotoformans]
MAPDESHFSWIVRSAAFHTGGDAVPFLGDLGVSVADIRSGAPEAVDRLCTVLGEDPEQVFRNTIRVDENRRLLRNEVFSSKFLRQTVAYCPACLLEDEAAGEARVVRRGRLIWLLKPVRTCPVHDLPLITVEGSSTWHTALTGMSRSAPEHTDELRAQLRSLAPRSRSPLQVHVEERLEGRLGSPWLDGQTIEQACRATEMLGLVLHFGIRPRFRILTEDDWDLAGRVGFAHTSRGEAGITEALDQLVERSLESTRARRPSQVYGVLFDWLQQTVKYNPGPIRELVRQHAMERLEVEPCGNFLGAPVTERRRYSIASLARDAGLHPLTLRNAMVTLGAVPAGSELDNGRLTINARAATDLAGALQRVVPIARLPELLNTSRAQAQQLVHEGLLPMLQPDPEQRQGRQGCAVDRREVDRFLAELEREAVPVADYPAGMTGIPQAAERAHCPTTEIVRLILAGRLKRIARLEWARGYGGILVDVMEVRSCLPKDVAGMLLTVALQRLMIDAEAGRVIADGTVDPPLLRTVETPDPTAPSSDLRVTNEDLAAFARRYVSEKRLGALHRMGPREVRRRLDRAKVAPILSGARNRFRIFRRMDIPPDCFA